MSCFIGIYFWPKMFAVTFSWAIYFLLRNFKPLKFLVCKSTPYIISKKLVASILLHKCLVLLLSNFCQKFPDFDQDNFWHFQVLLKQNRPVTKKSHEKQKSYSFKGRKWPYSFRSSKIFLST